MKPNGKSISFAELKAARERHNVQIIRPDAADETRQAIYLAEIRELWNKRSAWAKQLAMCDATMGESRPAEELFKLADEYAVAEWKTQLEEIIDLCVYLGRPVPEQVAFYAKAMGLEVTVKETDAKTLAPPAAS